MRPRSSKQNNIAVPKEDTSSSKEAEEYHRAVIEHAREMIFLVNLDTKYIVEVNPAFQKILGYTAEEATRLKLYDIAAHDKESVNLNIQQIQKEKHYFIGERRYRHKDGSLVEVEVDVYFIEYGKREALCVIARDISERKKAEEALKAERDQAERYLNLAEVIFVALDTQGIITLLNRKGHQVLGYEEGELIGKNWIETCLRPQDRQHVHEVNRRINAGEIDVFEHYENYVLTKKGEERFIAWHNSILKDDNGLIIGTLSSGEAITERKKMENALRESENMYRAIFENTGTSTIIIEDNTIISLANSEFERLTGCSKEEIEGKKSWTEFVVKEDLERMLEQHKLRRADPNAAQNCYEFRAFDKNGDVKNILLRVGIIRGTKKSIASLLDITERKRAEEELKETQSRLRIAMDLAKLVRWEYDVETDLFSFDNQFYALYRTTAEKEGGPLMSSQDYARKFIPAEEAPLVAKEIRKSLTTTDPNFIGQVEHRIIRGDGTEGFIAVQHGVVKDDKGHTIKTYGANQDITERKLAEKALKDSERKLAAIIEFLPDATFVIDSEKKIIAWNHAIEEMTGVNKDNMIGKGDHAYTVPFYGERRKHLLDLIDADDKEIASKYRYVKRKGNMLYAETYTPALYGGKGAYVWATGAPLFDNKGNRIGAIESIRDITDRKQTEDQIIASLREKEVLLKEIHHRVKNNLQIISSLLKIQSRYIEDDGIADVLKECDNRVRSMALIHENLYRSENLARVNFTNYISSLTSSLFSSFGVDKRRVNLKLDLDEVFLAIDKAVPCGLIVNELVSNCLKHAFPEQRSGEVYIELKHHDADKVLLVVQDNGVGLSNDLEPQESKTLGLKLVTDLVKQLRGNLQLDPRGGTEFRIVFASG